VSENVSSTKQIHAAFEQRRHLRGKHRLASSNDVGPYGSMRSSERANGAGNEHPIAGRFARDFALP